MHQELDLGNEELEETVPVKDSHRGLRKLVKTALHQEDCYRDLHRVLVRMEEASHAAWVTHQEKRGGGMLQSDTREAHTLLVGMQNDATALENSLTIPPKVKH